MPLQIVRNDITNMRVDAIVNAANNALAGGGGVDGCIHRAAGPGLLQECLSLGGCDTGSAKITGAYNLPAKYVIHTVGPVWRGGAQGEKELLISCYQASLSLAVQYDCASVAFPLLSSGAYGYPKDRALRIAINAISTFLMTHDMMVYIVVFDSHAYYISSKLFADIAAYIDENYVHAHVDERFESSRRFTHGNEPPFMENALDTAIEAQYYGGCFPQELALDRPLTLEEALARADESFTEMLLRKISEADMTDAECYKKANIDRKLFSKIRNDRLYKPSKATALAFAIALRLPMEEVNELLQKAGFAFSGADIFDLIVRFHLEKGNYDIFEINESLFAFDQNLLGSLS